MPWRRVWIAGALAGLAARARPPQSALPLALAVPARALGGALPGEVLPRHRRSACSSPARSPGAGCSTSASRGGAARPTCPRRSPAAAAAVARAARLAARARASPRRLVRDHDGARSIPARRWPPRPRATSSARPGSPRCSRWPPRRCSLAVRRPRRPVRALRRRRRSRSSRSSSGAARGTGSSSACRPRPTSRRRRSRVERCGCPGRLWSSAELAPRRRRLDDAATGASSSRCARASSASTRRPARSGGCATRSPTDYDLTLTAPARRAGRGCSSAAGRRPTRISPIASSAPGASASWRSSRTSRALAARARARHRRGRSPADLVVNPYFLPEARFVAAAEWFADAERAERAALAARWPVNQREFLIAPEPRSRRALRPGRPGHRGSTSGATRSRSATAPRGRALAGGRRRPSTSAGRPQVGRRAPADLRDRDRHDGPAGAGRRGRRGAALSRSLGAGRRRHLRGRRARSPRSSGRRVATTPRRRRAVESRGRCSPSRSSCSGRVWSA